MIGIDIEDIARFEKIYVRKNQVLRRLFSIYEWEYAQKKIKPCQTLAGIWCAKEAVVKAFSTIELLSIKDVNVRHLENGSPYVIFINSKNAQKYEVNISISHSKQYATAIAAIVK